MGTKNSFPNSIGLNMFYKIFSLFLTIIYFNFASPLVAQDCQLCANELLGNQKTLVADPGNQTHPAVASDPNGNAFVVWISEPDGVRGRLFGPLRTPKAPQIVFDFRSDTLSFSTVKAVFAPELTKYLVSWNATVFDQNRNPVRNEIRGQFVSQSGTAMSSVLIFAQLNPSDALQVNELRYSASSDKYFLLYSVGDPTAGTASHFVQRINAQGTVLGSPVTVNNDKRVTQVATGAQDFQSGRFIVAWRGPSEIRYQLFNSNYVKISGNKKIVDGTATGDPIAVYNNIRKEYLTFWSSSQGIKAAVLSPNGDLLRPAFGIGISGFLQAAAHNSRTGGFLLSYQKGRLLAKLDEDVSVINKNFLSSCQTPGRFGPQSTVRYSALRNEFTVMWSYINPSPQSIDIYARRIKGVSTGTCSN